MDAAASGADERRLGMPGPALTGSGGIYGPAASEALTTTLRDAAGVEIRLVASPLRAGPSRVVPTPHAGVKGAGRARVSDRSERHPKTPDGETIAITEESTKQAGQPTARGTPA